MINWIRVLSESLMSTGRLVLRGLKPKLIFTLSNISDISKRLKLVTWKIILPRLGSCKSLKENQWSLGFSQDLGIAPGLGEVEAFFLAPLFSVKPNSCKNKLKQKTQLLNFHGKTSFKFFRYQSLQMPANLVLCYASLLTRSKWTKNVWICHWDTFIEDWEHFLGVTEQNMNPFIKNIGFVEMK